MNTDIRYLAGFFDGEGTIGIYRNKGSRNQKYKSGFKSPSWMRHISVTNTYTPILFVFKEKFGGWIHELNTNKRNKRCFAWTISSKGDIARFLGAVMPWLNEKHGQAKIMLTEILGSIETKEAAKWLKRLKKK